jgi:hypothetical protein
MQELTTDIQPRRIGLDSVITKPVVILSVKSGVYDSRLYSLGNLSSTMGPTKSRKTAWECIVIGTLLGANVNITKFTKHFTPENILLFDTEQQDYELKRIVNSIHSISSKEIQPYLMMPFRADDRIAFILKEVEKVRNSFIVIDGIRDLVMSINSEEEAVDTVQNLKTLAYENNNHIECVIHVNPAENSVKARGWLGTEVMHKCESVVMITKTEGISKVHSQYLRDKDFSDFFITFSEHGIPEICEHSPEITPF